MKSVIVGAGAIGAYVGAHMARAGQDVTLYARGPHLAAMQANGVRVQTAQGEWTVRPEVTGDLGTIEEADVIFLAVKAHSLPQVAPLIRPLLGTDTVVISMQNGVPWWYFDIPGIPYSGLRLESIDPGGVISQSIESERILGSIAYIAAEIVEPGVVRHIESNRLSIGEPDGTRSDRCRKVAEALIAAGLKAPITTHLRNEIWVKLLGNMAFNPISALTGGTLAGIARFPETRDLVRRIMLEAAAIAAKAGLELPVTIEQRIEGAAKIGEHKTSMLQDLEKGRPLELEPITGAALEIGDKLGIPMPYTRAVYACTKLLSEVRHS
ncbi:MAG TPA: 2-dehydropantoate 2-reductase [Bryobacteraceae bacterium]|jgi:2-dehydropantoate 2-reductase|nr:2-dehydropantoate 2-reductase [Bryobacteraceae bacterium]